ncbi:amidohydrolase family protein [Nitrospirillum sp. BR 11163]|uniref:amidohydrolase family protein n=1 Tax=Nitrospirillum sp. BR 11163 TaxID=3104323 RepID=UPI002AFDD62F|nr:amidohydrolase family protein [Nitrospirillum sp. BR 11163]MEA1673301.1 amidohydrolase family protein [Nitrospirillum sp. BR 11163]
MLIDAHLHLWDPARLRYDWLSHVPSIAGPHTSAEWAALELPIEQAVFVQADCDPAQALDEVDWVAGLADRVPVGGIVAFAPLEWGAGAQAVIDALAARPLVRGVRRSVQNEPLAFVTDPDHLDGMVRAAKAGFSLDICARAPQLPALAHALDHLYAAVPDAVTVLDHLGKPDIATHGGDVRADGWADALARLARFPNLACKISGLTTQARWDGWRVEELRPYIDHVLACFGAGRCLFGGDWPVVDLAGGYPAWLALFQDIAADWSQAERDAVCRETARRVYRLGGG